MAENTQTFILVGDFRDNISPALKKLNTQIDALTRNFAKLQPKIRPIGRDLAIMSEGATRLADALGRQRSALNGNVRAMQQYRKEAGKIKAANDQMARSASRPISRPAGAPPRGGRGGGGGGGGTGGLAAAAGGFVAGEKLAGMMTGAITRGFNIGVGLMKMPFKYGANAIAERIQDEMSDISGAGGMFAIDKRENLGIFSSLDDARRFQEQLNAKLAQSAAALPGETAEYVQQGKMLTDTMMLSLAKNKEGFIKFAKSLDSTVTTDTEALAIITQKFTEKAVLLGKGSGGSSAHGVPQILERLVSQEKVNVKAFSRFSAYMSNPLLKNALENAEADLKKTAANSPERLARIQLALDEAVPNEVVSAMTNSAEGLQQAIKSAFMDPETGFFGLGRKLEIGAARVDTLGRYLNKNNEVVETLNEAYKDSASLFQILRETVGGFVIPLAGILDILPELYDPLSGLASGFLDLRDVSQQFLKAFNQYTKYYENEAQNLGKEAQKLLNVGDKVGYEREIARAQNIAKKAKLGGTLNALSDLLFAFGAIDESEYKANAASLLDIEKVNPAGMLKKMFTQLFDSNFMVEVGDAIGSLIGGVLKAVGDMMAGANDIASAGPFAEGLQKGFNKAKGGEGISLIFSNLFNMIGKAILTLVKSAPVETGILAAFTIGMPIIQGLITAGMVQLFTAVAAKIAAANILGAVAGGLGIFAPVAAASGLVAKVLIGLKIAFVSILGPIGLVALGVLGLVAIFRHLDLIASSLWEGLKLLGNGVMWLVHSIQEGTHRLLAGIYSLLSRIPGIGNTFEASAKAQSGLADKAQKQKTDREAAMAANMDKIGSNTVKSLERTKADIAKLKAMASGEEKPAKTAPKRNQRGGGQTSATPTAPAGSIAPTAFAPASASIIPPASFQPVQAAIATGTAATQTVNTSTRGVGSAVQQAKTASTQHALQHSRLINSMIVGINGVRSALMVISNKLPMQSTLSQVALNTAETNTLLRAQKQNVSVYINGIKTPAVAKAFGGSGVQFGNLGQAINYEMANKPKGSDLVIANSSETIIPAADGLGGGMKGVIDAIWRSAQSTSQTMGLGFAQLSNTIKITQDKSMQVTRSTAAQTTGAINRSISISAAGDRQILTAIKAASAAGGMGGALGGGKGSLGSAEAMARSMGLQMTSGFRPGDPGYHGSNRARDFSNGTGPTPQMMSYAQKMVGAYGTSLTELIYTPLGYSIKNGKKVAPYAQAAHYNHVHVAFGRGMGNPTMFSNANAAVAYESMMAPAGATISSVTANSSEFGGGGGGGTMNLTQNISISGALDPKAAAEAVWAYTTQAVDRLRYNNFG